MQYSFEKEKKREKKKKEIYWALKSIGKICYVSFGFIDTNTMNHELFPPSL